MMDVRIKEALIEIVLIVLEALKIFLVYIAPSLLVSILLSDELSDMSVNYPIVNVTLVLVAQAIKRRLPEDSNLTKLL